MNYPTLNDYWKQTVIDFIKSLNLRPGDIAGIDERSDYREGIGEEQYLRECILSSLVKYGFENYMIDKVYEWVLSHNEAERIKETGWDDYGLVINELVYSAADINGLTDDITSSIPLSELLALVGVTESK